MSRPMRVLPVVSDPVQMKPRGRLIGFVFWKRTRTKDTQRKSDGGEKAFLLIMDCSGSKGTEKEKEVGVGERGREGKREREAAEEKRANQGVQIVAVGDAKLLPLPAQML